MSPYEFICEPIEAWCLKNHYTDFLVTISINGHEQTEYLEYNGDTVDFMWLNDWWEGEEDVKLLGFIPAGDILIHNYPNNLGVSVWWNEQKYNVALR